MLCPQKRPADTAKDEFLNPAMAIGSRNDHAGTFLTGKLQKPVSDFAVELTDVGVEAQTFEILVALRDDNPRNPVCSWGIFGVPSRGKTAGNGPGPGGTSSSPGTGAGTSDKRGRWGGPV